MVAEQPTNFGPITPKAGAPQILPPPANPKSGGLTHEATQATQDGHQEERRRIRAKRTNEEANPESSDVPKAQPDMMNWLKQEIDRVRAEMMFSQHDQNMQQQQQPNSYQQSFPSQVPSENQKWVIPNDKYRLQSRQVRWGSYPISGLAV